MVYIAKNIENPYKNQVLCCKNSYIYVSMKKAFMKALNVANLKN